ncbi:MAG: response regulator transcription factor [Lachnospiraceae bacterium]|nr:response regulator transcription factor [Lachnospiraceae bacterium]
MYKILVCEDEENIVSFLEAELRFEGFLVDVAGDGEKAIELFKENEYDLILLDIMLPKKNGLECLREVRKIGGVPVIILTARKDVYDKVAFLNSGADDYITKPFETLELIARIKRNIERVSGMRGVKVNHTGLRVDSENYRVFIGEAELSLTKTEFEILNYLNTNQDKVKTRDEILNAVFGDFYGESNVVDVNVKNIRAKILKYTNQEVITTVRGKGYVIRV